MPKDVIDKLQKDVAEVLKDPELRARYQTMGLQAPARRHRRAVRRLIQARLGQVGHYHPAGAHRRRVRITMGMTITEKILARAAGLDTVQPGQFLDCKVDQVASMDLQGKLVFNTWARSAPSSCSTRDRVAFTLDHQSPAQTVAIADVHAAIRQAAKKFEVKNLFDVGSGIMHVVMPERGLVLPGELVVMNESHTPTGGAMGAVVIGVGQTDAAVAAALGEIWLVVPATIRVNLHGALRAGVTTKDVALHLMKTLGYERKAIYKTIEIGGPGVAALSMDARFTITNYCSDMGAKSAIFEPDAVTLAYARGRARSARSRRCYSDPDCRYEEVIERRPRRAGAAAGLPARAGQHPQRGLAGRQADQRSLHRHLHQRPLRGPGGGRGDRRGPPGRRRACASSSCRLRARCTSGR